MKRKLVLTIALILFAGFPLFSQTLLKSGDKAPDFILKDSYGKKYNLESLRIKSPVVVYFYPKAGTPGCTKEACGIRDDWSKFKEKKIQVLGISVDDNKSIKDFIKSNHLNFPLLSDADKKVSEKYGVLIKDKGIDKRVTFIIDKKGMIADIIEVNDIPGHAAKVLEIASKLR